MKSRTKAAVSLLIATIFFAGIFAASSFGLFSNVENKIYEPARLSSIQKKLDAIAGCSNEYISNLLCEFGVKNGGFMANPALPSFFLREPSDFVLKDFQFLKANVPSLEGIRVVDKDGKRVYFSSFKNDYKIEGRYRIYSDYNSLKTRTFRDELDFSLVNGFGKNRINNECTIVFDGNDERLVFSYPFFEKENEAVVIFYVNAFEFTSELYKKNLISINEKLTLISSEDGTVGGFVFGMPSVGQSVVAPEILKQWQAKDFSKVKEIVVSQSVAQSFGITVRAKTEKEEKNSIKEPKNYVSFSLITSKTGQFAKISGLYSSDILIMPLYIKIVLLICAFITACLVILIAFSLKKDDDVVIFNKIKKIQLSLLNNYFEKDYDRKKIVALIEEQKDFLSAEIKKSLGKRGRKLGKQLDFLLGQSWEDILRIFKGDKMPSLSSADMNELRCMFEEIVSSAIVKTDSVSNQANSHIEKKLEPNLKNSENIEELENLEVVEELDKTNDIKKGKEQSNDMEEVGRSKKIKENKPFSNEDEIASYHYENIHSFEGTEPLVIGGSANSFASENSSNTIGDDFFVSKPSDFFKDENYIEKDDDLVKPVNQNEEIFELEPLPNQEEFMFTPFAANDNVISELVPDAIVLGEDGVFHISENIQPSNIPLDEEFKKLVASVIK